MLHWGMFEPCFRSALDSCEGVSTPRERRRRAAGALLLLTLASPARAVGLDGTWVGTYLCAQGPTHGELAIRDHGGGQLSAIIHFSADPRNPGVPDGCFAMRGTADPAGVFFLQPTQWLLHPMGFVMVPIEGRIDTYRGTIDGRVDMPNCGALHGVRMAPMPVPFPACGGFLPP